MVTLQHWPKVLKVPRNIIVLIINPTRVHLVQESKFLEIFSRFCAHPVCRSITILLWNDAFCTMMVFPGSYFVIRTKNITSKEGIQKTKTNILGSVKIISISFDCLPPCGRRSMHRLAFPLVMLTTGPCGVSRWAEFERATLTIKEGCTALAACGSRLPACPARHNQDPNVNHEPWWHYSSRLWALASEVDLDQTKPIWPSCVICSKVIVEVALVEVVR